MTRTRNSGNQKQDPPITAARDRRGGRDHSRGLLRLVAAWLAGQRRRHRVARRGHAEPAARARLRDRARRPALGHRRLRDLDRDRGVRARQPPGILHRIRSTPPRWCASTSTAFLVLDRNLETRASLAHRCDRRAGIRDSAGSRPAGGHQAGRRPPASSTATATACVASCSARVDRRCSPCVRYSTARAAASRRAGSPSRAPSRRRWSIAWAASRRGRSPVFRSRTWIAPACPDEVREWVRQSPLTANLLTRVAGRSHLNGYLILRDQARHARLAGAARDPAQRLRAGDAHDALPDHPARPAGRRIHHRRHVAGGAFAPPQCRPTGARVALSRHHRAGAGRPAGGRCAHRRDRGCQSGRATAAGLHAGRTARPLGAVGAARPQRFTGSGHRDAGARRTEPRHRARAMAQGRPADGRRSELRAHRVAATAAWCPT